MRNLRQERIEAGADPVYRTASAEAQRARAEYEISKLEYEDRGSWRVPHYTSHRGLASFRII